MTMPNDTERMEDAMKECMQALQCLYIAVEESTADNVRDKVLNVINRQSVEIEALRKFLEKFLYLFDENALGAQDNVKLIRANGALEDIQKEIEALRNELNRIKEGVKKGIEINAYYNPRLNKDYSNAYFNFSTRSLSPLVEYYTVKFIAIPKQDLDNLMKGKK